jgi:DNA-binding LytR/AlgR family response regulator
MSPLVVLILVLSGIVALSAGGFVLYFLRKRKKQPHFQPEKPDIINFRDEKGKLRLSIKFQNLFYIESSDNYVNIYYESKGKVTPFLLRRSMKSIEDQYVGYPLVRCHRSYMVNVDKVKVLRNDKDGVFLDLDFLDLIDIPVSKTYSGRVIELFN